ncbi:MAG: LysM peptidoglycan-binding domain-containing protein [Pseudomonadota bacterium]|nr:LysM peptidoglycan-binding domain-containing protein [Pseudomonadota bacterium]
MTIARPARPNRRAPGGRRPYLPGLVANLGLCLFLAASITAASETAGEQSPFPRPAELEPDIAFWKLIYTGVDTSHGLIHDNRHLGVIYELIALPDYEPAKMRAARVKRAREKYRKILLELAGGKRENLSGEEKIVLDMWLERNATPQDLRDAAKRLRFQLGQSDRFREGWVRSGRWRAHIEETLAMHGVPRELSALPHVESSFNPGVSSSVGAVGLWQFTRSTGRRFMRVDHVVDERLDPFISTDAAARLLKYNLELTGTWPLAITAYNHGAAGMRRATARLGGTDIVPILRQYNGRAFGFASRNFYVAFLAALEADREAAQRYAPLRSADPEGRRVVDVPAYVPSAALSETLDVPLADLQALNPALRPTVWRGEKFVPKGFPLRLACEADCTELTMAMGAIPPDRRYVKQKPDRTHKVRRGQTLSQIASAHGFTTTQLLEINALRNRHHIRAGQLLRLPVSEAGPVTVALEQPVSRSSQQSDGQRAHRVRRGESLSGISDRYLVSRRELMALNGLANPDRIYVGQVLEMPAGRTLTVSKSNRPATHRVRNGDSLSIIVDRYGVSRADLMAWNGITDPNRIYVGQKMQLSPPAAALNLADSSKVPSTDAAGEDEIARVEAQARDETEILGPALPEEMHPDLSADPADYSVTTDGTIEVQAAETLGHYADWLRIDTQSLRNINGLTYGKPVPIGRNLKLDFSQVGQGEFEEQRRAFHLAIQSEFFQRYRIRETREHVVQKGESLWLLTVREYRIPVWLLRQYNPDLELNTFRAGLTVRFPVIEVREENGDPTTDCTPEGQQATPDRACAT